MPCKCGFTKHRTNVTVDFTYRGGAIYETNTSHLVYRCSTVFGFLGFVALFSRGFAAPGPWERLLHWSLYNIYQYSSIYLLFALYIFVFATSTLQNIHIISIAAGVSMEISCCYHAPGTWKWEMKYEHSSTRQMLKIWSLRIGVWDFGEKIENVTSLYWK